MPPSSSNAQKVYDVLRQNILDCTYKPGMVLSEGGLADDFKVSRTPIREALYRLDAEGLVKRYPHVGIIVSEVTVQDAVESFQVRELLEPFAARMAAEALEQSQLESLLRAFTELAATDQRDENVYKRHYEVDSELHDLITQTTHNQKLIHTINEMRAIVGRLLWIGIQVRYTESTVEHINIIKALLARDQDAAAQAMLEHLRNSKVRLTSHG